MAAWLLLALPVADEPTVGVYPPAADELVVDEVARAAAEAAVEAHGALRLVPGDAVERSVAGAREAGIECAELTPACVARIGAFAQLDFLVLVRATPGAPARLRVDLVDCVEGRGLRGHEAALPESADPRAAVRELVRAALASDEPRGTLRVDVSDGSATVSVDGAPRGETPLEIDLGIGTHEVRVDDTSGAAASERVEVGAGGVTALTLTPRADVEEEVAAADGDGALVFVGVGLLAAGVLGAAGVGVAAGAVAPDAARRADYSAREYNDGVALGRVLLGVSAVFGVLGVAGVGVAAVGLARDAP